MLKQTRRTQGMLAARYLAVLKRCFLNNAAAAVVAFGLTAGAQAQQVVIDGADVTVPGTHPSPWDINGPLTVGENAAGSLTISGGGVVSSGTVSIGANPGSTGTVVVTGEDSAWTSSTPYHWYIGAGGTGFVTISDGADVSPGDGGWTIGEQPGSVGVVEVSGGSTWTSNGGHSYVGMGGTGMLTISGGAKVSSSTTFVGIAQGSEGTVVVTDSDSEWAVIGHISVAYAGTGRVTVSSGGAVSASVSTTIGTGGVVEVTGNGSTWTASSFGVLGSAIISDGGRVSSTSGGSIGEGGTVEVTGNGSTWTTNDLWISNYADPSTNWGASELTISDGGYVKSDEVYLETYGDGGDSVINIGSGGIAGVLDTLTIEASADDGGQSIINFNHIDDIDFAPSMRGDLSVNQINSGATTLTGTNTYEGATTVDAGALRAGGYGVFSSGSAHTVNSGGTLDLNGFDQTIASLSNAGTVQIGALGSAGTVLTVEGNYTSHGGTLQMNVELGHDTSPADRLDVRGNTSGTSTVFVTNTGGTGALTTDGIEIITVGGASDGLFSLQSTFGADYIVAGGYTYRLYQGGISGTDPNNWYLRSTLPDGSPEYHVGAPVYESYPQVLLGLNGVNTLQQRVGNRFWAGPDKRGMAGESVASVEGSGVWGRIEGIRNHIEPRSSVTDTEFTQDVFKVQAGVDGLLTDNENGTLVGGVFIQYVQGKAKTHSSHYVSGEISTDGYGLGGTLTWYGKDGFYVDGQAQVMWYGSDLSTSADKAPKLKEDNDGMGYALSVETGKRMAIGPEWMMTPQAQLVYSRVDFDSFRDGFGSRIDLDKGDSLQGRLAVALERESPWKSASGLTRRSHVYGIAGVHYEFLEGTRINIEDVRFASKQDRLWGGVGLGGSYNWGNDRYSVYGEATVNTSLKHFGDSYAIQGNVGFRMKW